MFKRPLISCLLFLFIAQNIVAAVPPPTLISQDAATSDAPALGQMGQPVDERRVLADVHVLGEVNAPGTYPIVPNDRLFKIIQRAGGLTRFAAESRIELRRGKNKSHIVDLRALLRNGALDQNPFLQENDVIYIPAKLASARIQGPVRHPGVYEIAPNKTTSVFEIIDIAGGFTVGKAFDKPIIVIRFDESNTQKIFEVNNNEADLKSFFLKDIQRA
jgi:protein involved in polysaccharide export with SLBB domain